MIIKICQVLGDLKFSSELLSISNFAQPDVFSMYHNLNSHWDCQVNINSM